MSLENQVTRVSTGMKDTLKTLINKLGGNVTDELIDQYPELAASLEQVDAAGSAAQALSDAKKYTDQKIADIPTPDVSGQINTHNTDTSAHSDIRTLVSNHANNADIHVTADEKSAWHDGIRIGDVIATLPASAGWSSIAYGNGAFVAVGGSSGIVAYSDDGRRWSKVSMPADTYWSTVSFGAGKFVVLSSNSNIAACSTDGLRWTQTTMPVSGSWYSSAYGNGKFVAIIKGSDIAAYSTDGIQWTQTSMPSSGYWCSIAYGADKFVAVATGASGVTLSSSTLSAYSSDGISWTKVSLPVSGYWESVAYGNGTFIAVSRGYAQYNTLQKTNKFCYSTTGTTWSYSTLPSTSNWQAVTYGADLFVAITRGSASAAYSADGQTWTSTTLPISASWSSIVYGNNQFIAVASETDVYAYSADGNTWNNTTDGLTTASGTDVTAEVKDIIGASSSSVTHASTHATGGSDPITPESIGAIPSSDKGNSGGVATLDSSGKVPSEQIPSLEYAAKTHASQHASGGSDQITPASIGAMDAAWNTKIVAKSQSGSSTTGWYRVLCSNVNTGANTAIVNLRHSYNHGTPCSILALVVMDAYAPKINIIESSFKEKVISVSKLRLTKDENNNVYLDYYYGMSDANTVAISAFNMCSYGDITIMDFVSVDETPTGETVLVTQNLRQIPNGLIPIATIAPVTLTASAWDSSAKTQTVTVPGVLADETKQLITPSPALASQTAYYNAGIRCTGQSADKLTFTAKTIPTANLTVYVVIQEVVA